MSTTAWTVKTTTYQFSSCPARADACPLPAVLALGAGRSVDAHQKGSCRLSNPLFPGEGHQHLNWDDVSPSSTFLAEHLPCVLPIVASNGQAACSCSNPACVAARQFNATGTFDVSGLLRTAPLASTSAAAPPSEVESVADTDDSLSFSVSDNETGSLYSTPEQLHTPLPAVQAAPVAVAVHAAPIAVAVHAAPVAVAAHAAPVAVAAHAAPVAVASHAAPVAVPAAPVAVAVPAAPVAVAVPPAPVPPAPAVPITPHIDAPSMATTWYVVTRGRRVGVFDSWYVFHPSDCGALLTYYQGHDG